MIEIICPNTERVVAQVAEAVEADMDHAVAAARKAFDDGPWPHMRATERAVILHRFAHALKKREAAFAEAWTLQVGGLTRMAPFMVAGGAAVFESAADLAERKPWRIPADFPARLDPIHCSFVLGEFRNCETSRARRALPSV